MLLAVSVAVLVTIFLTVLVLNLRAGEKQIRYELAHRFAVSDPQFVRSMNHLLGPTFLAGNRVQALQNGDEIFPAMLTAIRSAQLTITFETFIYWSGKVGREFADALADRAKSGVRVHVLLDWLGSSKLDAAALADLKEAGVEVEHYRPLRWYSLSRMNNRTHRKILVVDGRVGFIGGVGIADQWSGHAQSPDHWRDSHFKLEGPAVAHLQAAFADNWMKTRADVFNADAYFPVLDTRGTSRAQVFKSSPREGADSARLMFLLSIAAARKSILIANAYFVPDARTITALVEALERGVQVEIIVPGRHIDTKITRRASRAQWGHLLAAGAAIYEYQPTMYHCKVMVIDGLWVSVGSANFDDRSFRLNDEANLNVLDRVLAGEQIDAFDNDKRACRKVSLQQWQSRPWRERAVERVASLLRSQV